MSFALTLYKVALNFVFFDLSNVDPSIFIITESWDSKDIILEDFIVFSFD